VGQAAERGPPLRSTDRTPLVVIGPVNAPVDAEAVNANDRTRHAEIIINFLLITTPPSKNVNV
jgi:hypothetical protein